jgi:hypothetical protein
VSVQIATLSQDKILLKAFVWPSMAGKPARPLWISFHDNKSTQTFCRCPAGKSGLCCHVSAILYILRFVHPLAISSQVVSFLCRFVAFRFRHFCVSSAILDSMFSIIYLSYFFIT